LGVYMIDIQVQCAVRNQKPKANPGALALALSFLCFVLTAHRSQGGGEWGVSDIEAAGY
jgi:hypothetical protein